MAPVLPHPPARIPADQISLSVSIRASGPWQAEQWGRVPCQRGGQVWPAWNPTLGPHARWLGGLGQKDLQERAAQPHILFHGRMRTSGTMSLPSLPRGLWHLGRHHCPGVSAALPGFLFSVFLCQSLHGSRLSSHCHRGFLLVTKVFVITSLQPSSAAVHPHPQPFQPGALLSLHPSSALVLCRLHCQGWSGRERSCTQPSPVARHFPQGPQTGE